MDSKVIVLVFEEEQIADDWSFSDATKADAFLENVLYWQDKGLVEIEDAVVVVRTADGDIKIKQTKSLAGKYTLRGSGIGLLAGMLLGGPIGGLIGGATMAPFQAR